MRTIPFIDTESLVIPRIIPFAGLMMLLLITTFALALQLTRQSTVSQEFSLNLTAHAIVYHGGQMMDAQWQLVAAVTEMSADEPSTQERLIAVQSAIATQRIRIAQHLQVLNFPAEQTTQLDIRPAMVILQEYRAQWAALQPLLDRLVALPQDGVTRRQVEDQLRMMRWPLAQLVDGGQQLFIIRSNEWLGSLEQLNSLLTSATTVLLVTVLLVSYLFYLFFRMQSQVEQALRDSATRLHAILETIPDAVLRLKRGGRIVDHKPAMHYQPFTHENCIGQPLDKVAPAAAALLLQQTAEQVFITGEQQTIEYQLTVIQDPVARDDARQNDLVNMGGDNAGTKPEQQVVGTGNGIHTATGDTAERTFEARFLPTANDEIQLLVRDITTEKAADAATLQAQKLESIGILAGGIAHDFNNILTGLMAQTTLARRKLEKGLPVLNNLDKAILSANRAADLTRQLLAYSGQGKFEIGPLNLNQLIGDTTALLEAALPSRTQLQLDLTEPLPAIEADRGQIQQIVMNLVMNAAEALHCEQREVAKGEVHVRTALCTLAEENAFADYIAEPLRPGPYVMLEVRDNGVGMDRAMIARIFDPFFSTKATGHGLGLSATLGIIRTHHGAISVESRPGEGTTFTILLPALMAEVSVQADLTHAAALPVDRSRAILVIDDEAPVRDAVRDILTDQGFAVVTAAGGAEGVAALRHQPAAIGLVLLDIQMPGLNGSETYQQLRQIEPTIKVIFTSGYSESEMTIDLQHTEGVTFLAKPYSAERLAEYVSRMMRN